MRSGTSPRTLAVGAALVTAGAGIGVAVALTGSATADDAAAGGGISRGTGGPLGGAEGGPPDAGRSVRPDEHLLTATPDENLQPDELSAKHAQLFVLDLLYVLIAQQNFPRTTTKLAVSAMAVLPHRRPVRKLAEPAAPRPAVATTTGTESSQSSTPRTTFGKDVPHG